MPLKPEDRAAYQREYRKARKLQDAVNGLTKPRTLKDERIRQLEAEVQHLKAELAKRPTLPKFDLIYEQKGAQQKPSPEWEHINAISGTQPGRGTFNSRPFTPAPKKGK